MMYQNGAMTPEDHALEALRALELELLAATSQLQKLTAYNRIKRKYSELAFYATMSQDIVAKFEALDKQAHGVVTACFTKPQ